MLYGNYDGEATPVWSSGSGSSVGSYRLETTEDGGNLVILDSDGNIIWSTGNEKESSSNPFAMLQDDGNLYLYQGFTFLWKARKCKKVDLTGLKVFLGY